MGDAAFLLVVSVLLGVVWVLGHLRIAVRELRKDVSAIKREFPECDHENWKLDRQLKIMWCEQCKRGRWYNIDSLEGKSLAIEK